MKVVTTEEEETTFAVIDDKLDLPEPGIAEEELNALFDSQSTPSGPLLVEDDCETPNPNDIKLTTTMKTEKLQVPDEKLDSLHPVLAIIENANPLSEHSTNDKDLSEANDWWDKVLEKVDENAKREGTFGREQSKKPTHGLSALEYMLEQDDVLNRLNGVVTTTIDPDCVTDENGELVDPGDYYKGKRRKKKTSDDV